MNPTRTERAWKVLCVIIVFLILTALVHFSVALGAKAQVDYGLGLKFLDDRLFGTGSIEWNNIKLEAGGNYGQDVIGELDRIDVFAQGKYLFFDRRQDFGPYIGVIGRRKQFFEGSFSANFSGGGVVGGLSFTPTSYLNIEAGAEYINYSKLTIPEWDASYEREEEKVFFVIGINMKF